MSETSKYIIVVITPKHGDDSELHFTSILECHFKTYWSHWDCDMIY